MVAPSTKCFLYRWASLAFTTFRRIYICAATAAANVAYILRSSAGESVFLQGVVARRPDDPVGFSSFFFFCLLASSVGHALVPVRHALDRPQARCNDTHAHDAVGFWFLFLHLSLPLSVLRVASHPFSVSVAFRDSAR